MAAGLARFGRLFDDKSHHRSDLWLYGWAVVIEMKYVLGIEPHLTKTRLIFNAGGIELEQAVAIFTSLEACSSKVDAINSICSSIFFESIRIDSHRSAGVIDVVYQ